jgi:hypothetical protein
MLPKQPDPTDLTLKKAPRPSVSLFTCSGYSATLVDQTDGIINDKSWFWTV